MPGPVKAKRNTAWLPFLLPVSMGSTKGADAREPASVWSRPRAIYRFLGIEAVYRNSLIIFAGIDLPGDRTWN
jgi:hypothetical protein